MSQRTRCASTKVACGGLAKLRPDRRLRRSIAPAAWLGVGGSPFTRLRGAGPCLPPWGLALRGWNRPANLQHAPAFQPDGLLRKMSANMHIMQSISNQWHHVKRNLRKRAAAGSQVATQRERLTDRSVMTRQCAVEAARLIGQLPSPARNPASRIRPTAPVSAGHRLRRPSMTQRCHPGIPRSGISGMTSSDCSKFRLRP